MLVEAITVYSSFGNELMPICQSAATAEILKSIIGHESDWCKRPLGAITNIQTFIFILQTLQAI